MPLVQSKICALRGEFVDPSAHEMLRAMSSLLPLLIGALTLTSRPAASSEPIGYAADETRLGLFSGGSVLPGIEVSGRYELGDHFGVLVHGKYFWVAGYADAGLYVSTGRSAVELSAHVGPLLVGGTVLVISAVAVGVSPGADLRFRFGPVQLALGCDAPFLVAGAFSGVGLVGYGPPGSSSPEPIVGGTFGGSSIALHPSLWIGFQVTDDLGVYVAGEGLLGRGRDATWSPIGGLAAVGVML
ncbi:MAG: hypothetical protein H6729_09800 [Deltaproteobacteria bacterium]|nr:hypothetical protein [Deltaproteobacteria bacterium]